MWVRDRVRRMQVLRTDCTRCRKRFAFAWKALTLSLRSTARSTSILAVTKVMGCVSRHGHPPLPRTRRDMAPAYHHHSIGVLMYLIASTLQVFTLRTGSVGGSTCLARTRKVHSLNLSKRGGYFNSHLRSTPDGREDVQDVCRDADLIDTERGRRAY